MRRKLFVLAPASLALLAQASAQDELYKFTSGAAGTQLGIAVALDGTLAGASAPLKRRVNLFNVVTGQKTFTLTASDGEQGDRFETSLALDAGRALVGAPFDFDKGPISGSAYLFDATTGQELLKFRAPDGQEGDLFGESIDLQGNRAIFGAQGHAGTGAAYVFDLATSTLVHKFVGQTGDYFGATVVLEGSRALVGTRRSALPDEVFVHDLATGQLITKLTSSDGVTGDLFSFAIAAEGDRAVVGASATSVAGSASTET